MESVNNEVYETDADGRWLIQGKARLLVEPSQAWLDARAAEVAAAEAEVPEPDPQAVLLEALAKEWDTAAKELRASRPTVAADAMERAAGVARAAARGSLV
jgi:hypothetical protein